MINAMLLTLICVLTLAACSPGMSQQQIPAASLEALQDVFTTVWERLWDANDVFWHRGDHERCIALLRLIAEINPQDFEAYDSGGWLMQSALRDDEAEALLRKGLANNPNTYEMYYNLGYFLYTHERFEEAIAYLETARAFESPILTLHLLAHSYELGGYPGDALEIWLQAEQLEPDSPVPLNQIDRILRCEPPTSIPAMMSRSREQRRKEKL